MQDWLAHFAFTDLFFQIDEAVKRLKLDLAVKDTQAEISMFVTCCVKV